MYRIVISPEQKQDEQILLTAEQQHYLYRVLRLKKGERFAAMDGQGFTWVAQLAGDMAQVLAPVEAATELSVAITLLVALPKGNGFEQVVRCCTELGVATIVPVVSDRTLLNPSANKLARWRKIAQEATEQSERQLVPTITEVTQWSAAVAMATGNRYICVARKNAIHLLAHLPQPEIVVATGPEGGWTEPEVALAMTAGFQPVSLGQRVLRAVTAPIAALSLVAAVNEA
ncbi:MAG: 16S rRNA (uracil(1498)-N(3))-methyltransferase [Cyanophyceae cyanobacterium]